MEVESENERVAATEAMGWRKMREEDGGKFLRRKR